MTMFLAADVKSKIKEIIAVDLDVNIKIEDINDDSSLHDDGLGLDSIAIINFIVLVEKQFEINFDETEISHQLFGSINKLAECVTSKINIREGIVH
jgi:acyl carrier protein